MPGSDKSLIRALFSCRGVNLLSAARLANFGPAARAARDRERASARRVFPTWGMSRGSRMKHPRRFWRRWRRNQHFPNFPDTEDTTVLLVETSAPLRFPNSYSTSCELQGRRSVRYNKVSHRKL